MPDDTIPDGAGDANQPEVDAASPEGTPDPSTPTPPTPAGADDAGGPEDVTSVVAATAAEGGADDVTSMMGATPAPGGPGDEATSVLGVTAETAEDAADDGAAGSDSGPRHAKRSGMSRTWVIAIVAAVVLLAGAGIALAVSSGKKTPKATPKSHPTSATMIPVTTPSGPACPLTGQPAPGGKVPQRPALAFKVDNYPTARPQSGLEDADIVFEEPVEGGITRFVAVFQCQGANLVGPIRSARAVDVPILDQLSKPLFVHAGGINPVIALVNDGNLINDDVFTHASIVQHPAGRYAPYDTYASTAGAWGLDPGDTTPPAPLYTYSSTLPTGTPVGSVHIPFSGTNDNTWTWSPINAAWLLSIGGVPANVADGGTRIGVANIVVQTVHVTYGPWLENSEGGLEVQSQLTGTGPLTVFRNGEEITGTWSRAALGDTTSLLAADGSTIALDPGKTWVELVPSTIPVTTTAPVSGTP
jgi:hypothetical protein